MSILKRIFSHGLLIIAVVVVAAGYYYRNDLFPGMFDTSSESGSGVTPEPVNETASNTRGQLPSMMPPPPQQYSMPGMAAPDNYMQMPQQQLPPASPPRMSRTTPPVPGGSVSENPYQQARQAYWQRKFSEAEKHYQALAEKQPDNPNAYGELGNVYFSQGKWKQAGRSYLEAATRLIAAGNIRQAMYLHRVIQGLDQESAATLQEKLSAAHPGAAAGSTGN